jgi:site-specific recombinase XerD
MVPTIAPPRIEGVARAALSLLIERYKAEVTAQGYARRSIRYHLMLLEALGLWLERRQLSVEALDEETLAEFLRHEKNWRWTHMSGTATLRRFLSMLRRDGIVAPPKPPVETAAQLLAREYEQFLLKDRALSPQTTQAWKPYALRFLSERFGGGALKLEKLRALDVTGYIQRHARRHGSSYARKLVAATRSFLRYLHYRGLIAADLSVAVPKVARWSLSTLPKHLPAPQVRRVLARCSRRTALGRRNYAVLLLLARLGLRAGEVIGLRLEDIDWENSRLTVRGKGSREAQLPMPADVARALANYLWRGRPRCTCRRVFIRDYAPIRGLARSGAIRKIVVGALTRAGVASARKGAHLLRHSLATEMLRRGASLDEIGEVLRHKSPDTTAIYAKVDVTALRRLALSWPGGGL